MILLKFTTLVLFVTIPLIAFSAAGMTISELVDVDDGLPMLDFTDNELENKVIRHTV